MKDRALYLLMEAGWEIESIEAVLGVLVKGTEQWEENYTMHGLVKPPRLISRCPSCSHWI